MELSAISNVIVVRFSLKLSPKWLETAYGDESKRGAWLNMRADLFDRTVYASVQRQTVKPKAVVMLLDAGDEAFWHERFAKHDYLVPAFGKAPDHYGQSLEAIGRVASTNVAISRCDSDDLIADDYLENVNRAIVAAKLSGTPFDYVVATRGYTTNGKDMQEIYYSCSPFLTRFAEVWDNKNIYSINHENVLDFPHVSTADARWMQYVHGTNIANNFTGSNLSREDFEQKMQSKPKRIGMQRTPAAETWPDGFQEII